MGFELTQNRPTRTKTEEYMLTLIKMHIANSESIPDAVYGGSSKSPEIIARNAMEDYQRKSDRTVGFCNVSMFYLKHDWDTNTAEFYAGEGEKIPLFEISYNRELI
jgi:hypothetical protein